MRSNNGLYFNSQQWSEFERRMQRVARIVNGIADDDTLLLDEADTRDQAEAHATELLIPPDEVDDFEALNPGDADADPRCCRCGRSYGACACGDIGPVRWPQPGDRGAPLRRKGGDR